MKKEIVILDYMTTSVVVYDIPDSSIDDIESFIISKGLDPSNCHWMVGEPLKIKVNNRLLNVLLD